jgi:hypothetical protein
MRLGWLNHRLLPALAALTFTTACSGPDPAEAPPSQPVAARLPPDEQAELDTLMNEIKGSANLTAAEFADRYHVPFASGLSYDPGAAQNLSTVQGSSFALDAGEMDKLKQNGFVISDKKRFPTFVYGYASLYAQDLPLFVSADSVLFAVHRSYDAILKALELTSLIPELSALLDETRTNLSSGGAAALSAEARADADLFLAVAKSLLDGAPAAPALGASAVQSSAIGELFAGATSAEGAKAITLFGVERDVDFSQFKPRGHYTDSPELERYFRAMMWLGRIDFRMLEAQPDLTLRFNRRQLEGALALRALITDQPRLRWDRIDTAVSAFVGEHDYMVLPELDSLLGDLGVADPAALAGVSDDRISQAILDGKYGTQRISSHIMVNGVGKGTMPLSSSFALFGQRYVVDSHVFSNVVYDRVQHGSVRRMMPSPLDAGFAALKNDQAGQLLDAELQKFGYAPDLHAMRVLVDAHPKDYWEGNLYNLWLSSLQTLSPGSDLEDPASDAGSAGLPGVASTEAWGRRLLNTQLSSWAELRHDTILYAKQSYTGGASCEFPDAYVEPYPAFFRAIDALALHGKELSAELALPSDAYLAQALPAYFDHLHTTASMLADMAEHERTGVPFTPEQMAFINEAVVIQEGCGSPAGANGWYPRLFFSNEDSVIFAPTIADVHTQPTDEVGNTVGRVLHVGTGYARLLALTVDTCTGPRAYVGLASSYFEETTQNFERYDDPTWEGKLRDDTSPGDVPWMSDLIAR